MTSMSAPANLPWGAELSRRHFLRAAGAAASGLTLASHAGAGAATASDDRAVILLMLVGGPSQFETWDPKPDAPAEIRGPFGAIATTVPGIHISEHLPLLARRTDRLTLVRSMHHDAAPIHETGHQLVQTGRLCRSGEEPPHAGALVGALLGARNGVPPCVILPGPIGNTGVGVAHGQSAGWLGAAHAPSSPTVGGVLRDVWDIGHERTSTREAYGPSAFGRNCLIARRLVEAGARFVTVNMYDTVFDKPTWDCHGSAPFATLDDYAREVLPTFDRAFAALVDDLEERGRLDTTLVVATGEFGRTPRLNCSGGRDHWPAVWSAALAGGGTLGGRVIGASDASGAYPADRPVSPPELLATMYRSLGIDPTLPFATPGGGEFQLAACAAAIAEVCV